MLSRLAHSPPSLHHFVMQGLPPLWSCWDVASPRPLCGFVRTFDWLIDWGTFVTHRVLLILKNFLRLHRFRWYGQDSHTLQATRTQWFHSQTVIHMNSARSQDERGRASESDRHSYSSCLVSAVLFQVPGVCCLPPQYGIWGLGPQHLILEDFRRRVPPG